MSASGTAAAFLVMVIKAQTVVLPMPSLAVCEQARADRAIQSQGRTDGPRRWLDRTFCVPAKRGVHIETAAVAELRRAVRNIPERLRACRYAAPKVSQKLPKSATEWLAEDPSHGKRKAFDDRFGTGQADAVLCSLGSAHKSKPGLWIDLPIPSAKVR